MNIKAKVTFFDDKITSAIGAGVYEIYVRLNNKETLLYVGESVFVLVRCASHLCKIAKGDGYLGFTEEMLNTDDVTIVFKLFDSIQDTKLRKDTEKNLIKEKNPKMQSGISDRVKPIECMIKEMVNILNE